MKRLFACFLVILMTLCATAGLAESKLAMDLVLVIDQSLSMAQKKNGRIDEGNSSDPNGYRMDAAQAMLSLCDMESSQAAMILFSSAESTEDAKTPMVNKFFDISAKNLVNRANMMETLESQRENVHSDTDIGYALSKAKQLIEGREDKSRKAVIVLLTDGDIDTSQSRGRTDSQSEAEVNEVVNFAATNNVRIYTIALNSGKKPLKQASINMLRNAAHMTDGLYAEAKSAVDLPEYFNEFYAHEVGSDALAIEAVVVQDEDGYYEAKVPIYNKSVAEANIMIPIAADSTPYLYKPGSNTPVKSTSSDVDYHKSRYFAFYKIIQPSETGEWKLKFQAPADAAAPSIHVVFAYDLTAEISMDQQEGLAKTDRPVVRVTFMDKENRPVEDPGLYLAHNDGQPGIVAQLKITGENRGTRVEKQFEMHKNEDCFSYELDLDNLCDGKLPAGTYTVQATLVGDGMNRTTQPLAFTVENHAPEVVSDAEPISFEINDPTQADYGQNRKQSIELSSFFREPEGETLTYKLVSIPENVQVAVDEQAGTMVVTTQGVPEDGSIQVAVSDPDGASASLSFPVKVSSKREELQNSVKAELFIPKDEKHEKGGAAHPFVEIKINGEKLTDQQLLDIIRIDAQYTKNSGEPEPLKMTLNRETGCFEGSFPLDKEEALYTVTGTAQLKDFSIGGIGEQEVRVGNELPYVDQEFAASLQTAREIHPFLWRSKDEREESIDLALLLKDTADDKLTYSVYTLPASAVAADAEAAALIDGVAAAPVPEVAGEALWTNTYTEAGDNAFIFAATDLDGKQVFYLHQVHVISQKEEVIHLLLLIAAGIVALILLIIFFYWTVVRKSWKLSFGEVARVIDGAELPVKKFPVSGKHDAPLSFVLGAESMANSSSPVRSPLDRVGRSIVMRPLSADSVRLTVKDTLPKEVKVTVNGSAPLAKKGDKQVWAPSGSVNIDVSGVRIVLARKRKR